MQQVWIFFAEKKIRKLTFFPILSQLMGLPSQVTVQYIVKYSKNNVKKGKIYCFYSPFLQYFKIQQVFKLKYPTFFCYPCNIRSIQ